MSALLPYVRFVRQLDLRTWDLGGRLRINTRTRYAEGRAGLSWTGVREYRTPEGTLRVLRRPEQVRSPGHLRTLRRMPTPPGHPSDDRDVLPRDNEELFAGFTGDDIAWEEVNGWGRPVADLTVIRPAVFAEMMPLEQWRDYCRAYPEDCVGVNRGHGPAKTGTSLGYNALWVSPTVEVEIVDESEGGLVGSWLGPDGKQYLYDVEHVIDPECELVLRLQRDEDFDPETLGAQHFAIALDTMTGRGGQQSELIRVVDSREIVADPTGGRVQVQAQSATPNSAESTPVDAAKVPKRCERTAETPALDAQENPMSETTKQNVVIGVRDQGVANFMAERKLKPITDLSVVLDMLDANMIEAKLREIMGAMAELAEAVKMAEGERDEVKEELGAAKAEMVDMSGKMADMPSVEELTSKLGALEVEAKATEEELVKAKAAAAKATDDTKSTIDSLQTQLEAATALLAAAADELAPVRAEQLKARAQEFVGLGLDEKLASACDSAPALERAFAAAHISERYGQQSKDDKGEPVFVKSADAVSEAVEVYLKGRGEAAPSKGRDAGAYTPGLGLQLIPTPKIVKAADTNGEAGNNDNTKTATTSSRIAAACE